MIYTLPHIIESAARKYPAKEAFRCGSQALSYGELDIKTNQLAKYLIDSGVQKGDRVGIYMNRCLETVLAVYGIMKSGAAYVPLDALAPHERTLYLLKDCGIQFLATTPTQAKRIKTLVDRGMQLKGTIGLLNNTFSPSMSWDEIYQYPSKGYSLPAILAKDLAYIMYTSGSTGAPKGIMHSHYSGLSYAKLSANLYGVDHTDRVGNHAPLHFDISTFGYFSAPLAGATTIIVTDAHTKLPVSLAKLIADEKLTIWYSVPLALIQLWLSEVLEVYPQNSLKWVLFGGENFTIKYLKELMRCWPHARFSNVYGPAEVNQCTYHNFSAIPDNAKFIPIGRVWGDTEYKIFNDKGSEVQPGQSGELLIRSSTMMIGYWNNKELTQKSIYHHPVGDNLVHRYYKTGDMVKKDQNGDLIFLGRNDRQVKLRGYRIEIDEVEAVLKRHQRVTEASVCVIENENNDKMLVAAVIGATDVSIETEELRRFCKTVLPPYAVPNTIHQFDSFPRTSSGKVDLSSLKKKLIAL